MKDSGIAFKKLDANIQDDWQIVNNIKRLIGKYVRFWRARQ